MKSQFFKFFQRIAKGDEGEKSVLEAIHRILQEDHNYFLIPKAKLSNGTCVVEVDLTPSLFGYLRHRGKKLEKSRIYP